MNLFVIDTLKELKTIKESWNTLYKQGCHLFTTFQSWDLNYHWWKVNEHNGKLHIICIGNKNNIKFIFPTYINKKGTLCFIQDGSVDYLDAIYSPNEQIYSYIKRIKDHILATNNIEAVTLNHLKKDSLLLDCLPYYFRKTKFYIIQGDSSSIIPYNYLDENRFLNHIKSKQFKNLRQIDSKLNTAIEIIEKQNFTFPEEIINFILDKMVENGIREKSVYHHQLNFMKELYNLDKIFFIAQKSREEYISITCLVRLTQKSIMSWMALYDPNIKNNNLKNYLHIFKFCMQNRYDFDLGTGIYPYKIQNFSPNMNSLYTFYFYKNSYKFVYYFLRKTVAKVFGKI